MTRKPFPFQERVGQRLLAGRNVVLQAPTGAGKTRAALRPWMIATRDGGNFPWRCIYSVPMRVLAQQFVGDYRDAVSRFSHAQGFRTVRATIQTGDQPDDPLLENALIFATLDQTLSSALGIPYAVPPKLANINAGAVMSSYLVWDEFHLFGRRQALPTTLHLMKMLHGVTPFCLMTATFSRTLLDELAGWLDAEVVEVPEQELDAIPSQQAKERVVHVDADPLNARAVLDRLERRTIAICNTVERAQHLYRDLIEVTKEHDIEVRLIHSRFYSRDRESHTHWAEHHFGEGWATTSAVPRAILIATQAIEVGVNITCQTLHTELAPANTLVQRAGRCARFVGEQGAVIVHDLPRRDDGRRETAPYDMAAGSTLCELTWDALQARDGTRLRYPDELELLETVHAADDKQLLKELTDNEKMHVEKMLTAMATHNRALGRELIREVDNYSLVIHPDPNSDTEGLVRSPWACEALSLPRGTFRRLAISRKRQATPEEEEAEEATPTEAPAWLDIQEEQLDWALAYPIADDEGMAAQQNVEKRPRFIWKQVKTQEDLRGQQLFAIHPTLVTYTPDVGLELFPNPTGSPTAEKRDRTGRAHDRYGYELERYAEHIARLWYVWQGPYIPRGTRTEYPALRSELAYTFPRLAARCCVEPTLLENAIRWMIATHDVGKLGNGWQRWVAEWQALIGKDYERTNAYAHTDHDGTKEHGELQKALNARIGVRPPHAAESAASALPLLIQVIGQGREQQVLGSAVVNAVVRHHGALHTGALQKPWQAEPSRARAAMAEALACLDSGDAVTDAALLGRLRWSLSLTDTLEKQTVTVKFTRPQEPLLYLWLSRVLRLCDQRSLSG